ncbi:MAG: radical SAM protein, partial [Myxococcota bacterium]
MNHHALKLLLARYDRPGPRYTSYPTAVQFTDAFGASDYVRHLERANAVDAPLSLYVHLPFCQQRCLFCACNTIVSPRKQAVSSYLKELETEIELVARHLPDRRHVVQLHLGGGTPTYFAPHELSWLMKQIRSRFTIDSHAELSIEVDPRVTTPEHIHMLV